MPETAHPTYTERKHRLMALKDVELVRELYDYAGSAIPCDQDRDGMYWLLGEAVERWAPTAAWLERAQELREQGLDNEIDDTRLGWLETIGERWQLAGRLPDDSVQHRPKLHCYDFEPDCRHVGLEAFSRPEVPRDPPCSTDRAARGYRYTPVLAGLVLK